MLYSISIIGIDYNKGLKDAQHSYKTEKNKFIERNYIGICKDYNKILKIISSSSYISQELKQEYKYRYQRKEYK